MDAQTILEKRFGGKLRQSSRRDFSFKEKNVYWYEFYTAECPICGHSGWCLVNAKGTKVICMRKRNDHPLKSASGGYMYYLKDQKSIKIDPSQIKQVKINERTNPFIIDMFNRSLLFMFGLDAKHRNMLRQRGLSDETIDARDGIAFGSFDAKTIKKAKLINYTNQGITSRFQELLENLNLPEDSWKGVPGLYEAEAVNDGKHFHFPYINLPSSSGTLVPYYDIYNRISGFQYRVDDVSRFAEVLRGFPKDMGKTKIYLDRDQYTVVLKTNSVNLKLAHGKLGKDDKIALKINYQNQKFFIAFKVKTGSKYLWLSSSRLTEGTPVGSPVEVAYNPEIAELKANDPTLTDYIRKPNKAVWLTEGGLKGLITSSLLPNAFTDDQLEYYGRDVLAVAGVSSYRKVLPILRELNVTRVTTAFDMDFLQNEQVKDSYQELMEMLKKEGFEVNVAYWSEQKGIDDALSHNCKIQFISGDQLDK